MGVLLIGSGGREHALAYALSRSRTAGIIHAAPGNGGIAEYATCIDLDVKDHAAVIDFCNRNWIDLVIVGPEQPLVDGLIDSLGAVGIRAFGPSRKAAQLEASKAFTKDFCTRHNIPTARYRTFEKGGCVREYIKDCVFPIVVKADGLAAGKGVTIARNLDEAQRAVDDCFSGKFGDAGRKVVFEEFLEGEEASFFVFSDGEHAMELPTAQDHKRAYDNDEGPNTGGMGAYSPAPVMTDALRRQVMDEIILPTLQGMKAEGMPFQGLLYAGLMMTSDGPKLIEYNVRFGDPECQVLMMRLRSDIMPVLLACCDGKLHLMVNRFDPRPAVTVVMAARGYPGDYEKGSEIRGLDAAAADPDVKIFHAGTTREGDRVIATGGRVLNVTALGDTVQQARDKAYAAIAKIDWPEGFCRTDIASRAIGRETGNPA